MRSLERRTLGNGLRAELGLLSCQEVIQGQLSVRLVSFIDFGKIPLAVVIRNRASYSMAQTR